MTKIDRKNNFPSKGLNEGTLVTLKGFDSPFLKMKNR